MKKEDVKLGMKVKIIGSTADSNFYRNVVGSVGTVESIMSSHRYRNDHIHLEEFKEMSTYGQRLYFFPEELEPYEENKQVNYIEQVAKMLGVEVGEKFNINGLKMNPYRLEESGLVNCNNVNCDIFFSSLITGKYKLDKIVPYAKPVKYESGMTYKYINIRGEIIANAGIGGTFEIYLERDGNMFDPHAVIPKQQISEIVKKLKGDES